MSDICTPEFLRKTIDVAAVRDSAAAALSMRLTGKDRELLNRIVDTYECQIRILEGIADLERVVWEIQQQKTTAD